MAVNSLCTAFRRVILHRKGLTGNLTASYSTRVSKTLYNATPILAQNNCINPSKTPNEIQINFVPRTLNIDFGLPIPDASRGTIVDLPITKTPCLDRILPDIPFWGDLPKLDTALDLPAGEVIEKQAERMIVIRRKKMKKHQRKKMRKRLGALLHKIRVRREIRKEKKFVEEQEAKVFEAQNFSAEAYVKERLELYKKEVLPKTYRGEILPQSVVKSMLNADKMKREKILNKPRLKL